MIILSQISARRFCLWARKYRNTGVVDPLLNLRWVRGRILEEVTSLADVLSADVIKSGPLGAFYFFILFLLFLSFPHLRGPYGVSRIEPFSTA
jgi:hypothetical protein